MAQFNDTGYGTVQVVQPTPKSRRINYDGTIAGAAQRDIGITVRSGDPATATSGSTLSEPIGFSAINKQGTQKATIDGPVAANVPVYTAADGKVTATAAPGTFLRGISVTAGTVDNEVIEILPILAVAPEA